MDHALFLTLVSSPGDRCDARMLIESLRTFGGELSSCPFWLFDTNPEAPVAQSLSDTIAPPDLRSPANLNIISDADFEALGVQVISLPVPPYLLEYPFGDKVYACATAEELAPAGTGALVWIDVSCLVVNPPQLYALSGEAEAAFRPVHICNVGSLASAPVDGYWQQIYNIVGGGDSEITVESFIDQQLLRAYFNTHAFAINPARGLLHKWLWHFEDLAFDKAFQAGACHDDLHKVFLHQAVLSALVAAKLNPHQLRILPPSYNYPYNLHARAPEDRRSRALNDLVTFTYEGRSIRPGEITDIELNDPLSTWLQART